MRVLKTDYSNWRKKYKHGDIIAIHEYSKAQNKKLSRNAISGALNGGAAAEKTIQVINEYYKQF